MCWRYVVTIDGDMVATTGDAGYLYPMADIKVARFYNFLSYAQAWFELSSVEKEAIKATLPVSRTPGSLPADGEGRWAEARDYGAGGVKVTRKEFRP